MVDDLLPDRSGPQPEGSPDPTSPVAVALDRGDNPRRAPRVIAKGRGAVATQILEIAFERGIKVRSDADLAEILGAVELDSEIPLEALAAVAEILSYVYRRQAALAGGASQS